MSLELSSITVDSILPNRFRTVLDVASDAMFLIHRPSLAFLDVNTSACRLLGYSREELLKLAPMALTGHPREYHEQMYDSVINGSKTSDTVEVTLLSKAGTMVTLEMQRFAHFTTKGWIILAVARDLSEIKQARDSAARAAEELARLTIELQTVHEQERKQLATRLHGDLGQLLAAMRINLSLLQQQLPDAGSCKQALESMDKLMVSSISTLRKIMTDLRPSGVEDGELYQALMQLAQETTEQNGLSCELLADEVELLLDESRSTMIYRLIEDALAIVVQSSSVKNITIRCERGSDVLDIEICSDGSVSSIRETDSSSYRFASLRERVKLMSGRMEIANAEKAARISIHLAMNE